ncbi:AsmA-like C-terminal region-containing protein [Flavobacterium sp. CYK-4]|uniref:AsmA-like C-terminal region-containing protein n=1 Tax=Flavobacterium lotistagni TaxID=2709660 RepID=UPI00140B20F4|nr:AsmA-like C-terminal region-containing protein [Flavobacterium lotistagni]NHM08294.1 AsmA-like C-terminal region-containing protein [Flavobacterium lotistagni]
MIKKILKIVGVVLLLLILSLVAIPFFFQDAIKAKITEAINEKVDAKVSFADADLSLLRSFPQASIAVEKLLIINKAPFEGDTLISMGELHLKMSVKELFKSKDESMNIEAISTENALINIIFNKDGIGNFDIALKDDQKSDDGKSDPLSLKLKEYKVTNLRFTYFDERSKVKMVIDSLNHNGTGDFAQNKLDLDTHSSAKVSLFMDKANYMDKVALTLDAVLGIDLDQSKYTFKQNKALINQLPLEFDGFIQMVENGQQYDLKFKTPTSSFQNFLGLIPASYAANIKDVKTTGDFTVAGFAKGLLSDTTVPKFNVAIASNNASFQYPNLPKSVQSIVIDTKIINETGAPNDTYVNLDQLSFRIDQDAFNAKANIKNMAENALVDAQLNGVINLGNVSKAYPVKLEVPLSGILKADVNTKFDMKSVETNQYEKMQNSGNMTLTGFKYVDENKKTMNINKAAVAFTNTRINLQELDMTTGKTDMKVSGVLENFYGFMLKNQELKGNFNLQSNQFAVSDFMTAETPKTKTAEKPKEAVKIPAFLNCSLTAKANTVLYDNLALKNVSGKVIIKDQKVALENIKTDIFGGQITASGDVSTKGKIPNFNMNLGMKAVDIQQTFTQMEMMKKIAPIAGVINGKLNTNIKVSGNLNAKEMTPDMNTLSGDLIGQMLSTTVNPSNSEVLSKIDQNLKFIDLKKLNLNDLKAALTFKDGKVNVKPFDLKYQDVKLSVGGQHGFDQNMNYSLKLDVPAKYMSYLGPEVNKLISKLSPTDISKLNNIPINASMTGNFKNPKMTTDLKSGVTNLTNQIVQQQKQKLVKQGTNALSDLINKNTKTTDTTKSAPVKEDIKKKAGDLLNGIFKKK